jgi:hypothetical protein
MAIYITIYNTQFGTKEKKRIELKSGSLKKSLVTKLVCPFNDLH